MAAEDDRLFGKQGRDLQIEWKHMQRLDSRQKGRGDRNRGR